METWSYESSASSVSRKPEAANFRTAADRLRATQTTEPGLQEAAFRALLTETQQCTEMWDSAEMRQFVTKYFSECLRASRSPSHRSRLQGTACLLAETIFALFDAEPVPMQTFGDLKALLGETIRQADPFVTEILVSHCLEKLFESRRIASLFSDWQEQPVLGSVYERALAWGEGFWPKTLGF
jgi:hypothetical protein